MNAPTTAVRAALAWLAFFVFTLPTIFVATLLADARRDLEHAEARAEAVLAIAEVCGSQYVASVGLVMELGRSNFFARLEP